MEEVRGSNLDDSDMSDVHNFPVSKLIAAQCITYAP